MKPQTIFFTKPGSGLLRVILSITLALWSVSAATLTWLLRLLELTSRSEETTLTLILAAMVLFAYSTVSGAVGLVALSSIRSYDTGHPKNYVSERRASRKSLYREYSTGSRVGYGAGHRYVQSRYYEMLLYSSVNSASYPVAL